MPAEPNGLVEVACAAGMDAVRAELAHADASIETVMILLRANDVPTGENDACVAAEGVEDDRDAPIILLHHLLAAAKANGLDIQLIGLPGRG